jgi:hypothetical protein
VIDTHEANRKAWLHFARQSRLKQPDDPLLLLAGAQQQNIRPFVFYS